MQKDNPEYFEALSLYHDMEQEMFNRQFGNGCIIAGGVLTTIVTFGAGSPLIAFGGMATGVTAAITGTAKAVWDYRGRV